MLHILIGIVFALSVVSVQAEEEIQGAFGLKLGDTFDVNTAIEASFAYGNSYKFAPPRPYPGLNEYFVRITPITRVIFRIIARGKVPSKIEGWILQDRLMDLLEAKYGVQRRRDDLGFDSHRTLSIRKEERTVSVSAESLYGSQNEVILDYLDYQLWSRQRNEQAQIDAQKAREAGL